jgi:hypothetical protein
VIKTRTRTVAKEAAKVVIKTAETKLPTLVATKADRAVIKTAETKLPTLVATKADRVVIKTAETKLPTLVATKAAKEVIKVAKEVIKTEELKVVIRAAKEVVKEVASGASEAAVKVPSKLLRQAMELQTRRLQMHEDNDICQQGTSRAIRLDRGPGGLRYEYQRWSLSREYYNVRPRMVMEVEFGCLYS